MPNTHLSLVQSNKMSTVAQVTKCLNDGYEEMYWIAPCCLWGYVAADPGQSSHDPCTLSETPIMDIGTGSETSELDLGPVEEGHMVR